MKEVKKLLYEEKEKSLRLEKKVEELQKDVNELKLQCYNHSSAITQNEKAAEENEQYGRRVCLRINGIPTKENESADDVRKKVKLINKTGCKIPDDAVDRAHRIGKKIIC